MFTEFTYLILGIIAAFLGISAALVYTGVIRLVPRDDPRSSTYRKAAFGSAISMIGLSAVWLLRAHGIG